MNFKNESKEPHALIFARLGEGYTVDEAVELEGKKGSATEMMRRTFSPPRNHDGARAAREVRHRVAEALEAAGLRE